MKAADAIFEYGLVLVRHAEDQVADAENLPLPKAEMKTILLQKMKGAANLAQREAMKVGFLQLARFQAEFDNKRAFHFDPGQPGNFHRGSRGNGAGSDRSEAWNERVRSERAELLSELNELDL